jgi:hypothetical protein
MWKILNRERLKSSTVRTLPWDWETERLILAVIPRIFNCSLMSDVKNICVWAKSFFLLEKFGDNALNRVLFDEMFLHELLQEVHGEMRVKFFAAKADDASKYVSGHRVSFPSDKRFNDEYIPICETTNSFKRGVVPKESTARQNYQQRRNCHSESGQC